MTDEQRERMLDRLLENQAHHYVILQKLEESHAHHDVMLQKLEDNQAHHDMFLQKLEESHAKLEELQMTDHIAISRLNNLMADFAEKHHAAMIELDNGLIRLEALIEAFIRGSRHNGGRRKS